MQRIFLSAVMSLFMLLNASAQEPAAGNEPVFKDSAAILQDLMNLLDSADEPTSYFLVSASIGNRLFSLHNNQLNAWQSTTTIVYDLSLGYFHKSGFSLSGRSYLLNEGGKGIGFTQHALTAAFDLPGNDKFSFGASYTRYFIKDEFSPYSSPIQNDCYASVSYKKPWIEPGIALGYSTGQYKQLNIKDTTINNIRRVLRDTASFKLTSFSMMLSAGHRFEWYSIFNKKDGVELMPSFLLNLGSSAIDITHKTNAPNLLNFLIKRGKVRRQVNNTFQAESAGLFLNCNYVVGNFSLNPQIYFDYYLHDTTEDRFTAMFTLSLGFSF